MPTALPINPATTQRGAVSEPRQPATSRASNTGIVDTSNTDTSFRTSSSRSCRSHSGQSGISFEPAAVVRMIRRKRLPSISGKTIRTGNITSLKTGHAPKSSSKTARIE